MWFFTPTIQLFYRKEEEKMSRAHSLLLILGLLVFIVTPSLARSLEDEESTDLDVVEDHDQVVQDEELLWGIDNLIKNRHRHRGRHAPPPHNHDGPKHGHHHAPPPHHRRHHAPPPAEGFWKDFFNFWMGKNKSF